MTITTEQFQQQYGFKPGPKADVNELHALIQGNVDAQTKANIIDKYTQTTEGWVRLFENSNDANFIRAIIIDAKFALWPKGYQPENISNPQIKSSPVQMRFDAYQSIVAEYDRENRPAAPGRFFTFHDKHKLCGGGLSSGPEIGALASDATPNKANREALRVVLQ